MLCKKLGLYFQWKPSNLGGVLHCWNGSCHLTAVIGLPHLQGTWSDLLRGIISRYNFDSWLQHHWVPGTISLLRIVVLVLGIIR